MEDAAGMESEQAKDPTDAQMVSETNGVDQNGDQRNDRGSEASRTDKEDAKVAKDGSNSPNSGKESQDRTDSGQEQPQPLKFSKRIKKKSQKLQDYETQLRGNSFIDYDESESSKNWKKMSKKKPTKTSKKVTRAKQGLNKREMK